ncbi:hypothetical protein Pmani_025082 [Petrolisthes manimaculis]|uniref:Cation-transporting P-type ATPase N-terminal domain-containing protein n=1 Tax=Petrolisthes manimaculis TaxID=1843537 RepID=A0AAE1P8Y8_9EUCA|nr:hypothetical protein Pmani_025082 [Petrolisthes manimaculis]
MEYISSDKSVESDITLLQLRELMEARGMVAVERIQKKYGSVIRLAMKLGTSPSNGLSGDPDDIELRREKYGSNIIPPKPPKTLL